MVRARSCRQTHAEGLIYYVPRSDPPSIDLPSVTPRKHPVDRGSTTRHNQPRLVRLQLTHSLSPIVLTLQSSM
jgi:hypothetical protein